MKNLMLILTTCFVFLNSLGLKTELEKNLLSARNQPTTLNLVAISMAKSQDTQVSEWYVEKFINNIIKFDSNMNDNLRYCFIENFNKIVVNPVGRVLLFRILIETRKRGDDATRERLKQITIKEDASLGFGFHEDDATISFMKAMTRPCVIKKRKHIFKKTTYKLKEEKIDNIDINLFHEMCHWFHALQDRKRKRLEGNNIENLDDKTKALKTTEDMKNFSIARYYWGNIENFNAYVDYYFNWKFFGKDVATVEMDAQFSYYNNVSLISFEEIRTILGTTSEVEDYQEGDDLCENLYRISKSLQVRWSHNSYRVNYLGNKRYYPDETVLQRAINSVNMNFKFYKINDL